MEVDFGTLEVVRYARMGFIVSHSIGRAPSVQEDG